MATKPQWKKRDLTPDENLLLCEIYVCIINISVAAKVFYETSTCGCESRFTVGMSRTQ